MDEPFLEVVKCLNARKARYVVIGGNAVAYHGVPRGTFDLDIFIAATIENATHVLAGLKDAGLGTADLTTPDRLIKNQIVIFNDWIPVDVMTDVPGLRFETVWKNRVHESVSRIRIPWISRKDLIRAKRASHRDIDLSDVNALIKIRRRRTT